MNCKLCRHSVKEHLYNGDDKFDCMLCTCNASSNDLEDLEDDEFDKEHLERNDND